MDVIDLSDDTVDLTAGSPASAGTATISEGSAGEVGIEDTSRTPIVELIGSQLEWSTVVAPDRVNRKGSHSTKACVFCDFKYTGGPVFIRQHLDKNITPRHIHKCEPKINWFQRHAEVVCALRERAEIAKRALAVKVKRSEVRQTSSNSGPIANMRPTREQVIEQWMLAFVKKGLCLHLVDDEEFRAAVLATARAGNSFVDAQKGDSLLPRRTYMTNTVLPMLDAKLDAKVARTVNRLVKETGAMLISDGWTSVQARQIVNCLLATAAGSHFIKAVDTSGHIKDAQFIADFVCEVIQDKGPENIVVVCMDGACKASFSLITAKYEHVFCFICPAHSVDNFLKNVCSDLDKIKVKSIEGVLDWGTSIFSEPIADTWENIKFITHHSKPLSIF